MIQQLEPRIPVETPKGKGDAVMVIDYSEDHDLWWVVFLHQSRECWTFKNCDIRAVENLTRTPRDFFEGLK